MILYILQHAVRYVWEWRDSTRLLPGRRGAPGVDAQEDTTWDVVITTRRIRVATNDRWALGIPSERDRAGRLVKRQRLLPSQRIMLRIFLTFVP